MSADSGIPVWCISCSIGPERLHSPLEPMTVRFRIRSSNRNGLAILALALLAFFLLMVMKAQHAEPKYDGRTVRQWVEAAQSANPVVATQALASLRSIGTNAILGIP